MSDAPAVRPGAGGPPDTSGAQGAHPFPGAGQTQRTLAPAMPASGDPDWPGARWIGVIDEPIPDVIALGDPRGFSAARLLVRRDGRVRGFAEVPVYAGRIDGAELRAAADGLPAPSPAPDSAPAPSPAAEPDTAPDPACGAEPGSARAPGPPERVTVVICTRDRAGPLATALESVLALDHPDFDVVIVDNAPATDATRRLVLERAASSPVPLTVVTEPRPGLARARNTGLRHAVGELVAFTDDDVVVDPGWLRRLADGFARAPDVVCVTGLVPSGELRSAVQAYFEQRVDWASSCRAEVFRLAEPPTGVALFPFRVGLYGTGANFALRRASAFALGGFDEALGVGTPTRGGEDVDWFVRVLLAGHALAWEPSALVWHRHRTDPAALAEQAAGYGAGLGAWLTKIALDPATARLAAGRAGAALRRAGELATPAPAAADPDVPPAVRAALRGVGRTERLGLATGPARYLRSRRHRPARPLLGVDPAPPPGGSR